MRLKCSKKRLRKEIEDTAESIVKVSDTIFGGSGLVVQLAEVSVRRDLSAQQQASAEDTQSPRVEAKVLAEDDGPLVPDFIHEADEHIETSEAGQLEIETRPDDKEVLNRIYSVQAHWDNPRN